MDNIVYLGDGIKKMACLEKLQKFKLGLRWNGFNKIKIQEFKEDCLQTLDKLKEF